MNQIWLKLNFNMLRLSWNSPIIVKNSTRKICHSIITLSWFLEFKPAKLSWWSTEVWLLPLSIYFIQDPVHILLIFCIVIFICQKSYKFCWYMNYCLSQIPDFHSMCEAPACIFTIWRKKGLVSINMECELWVHVKLS